MYIAIDKRKCNYSKISNWTDHVDIGKILMPKKASFGKIGYRYFIGSKNNENVIRVRIKKGKKWIERSLYYTQI